MKKAIYTIIGIASLLASQNNKKTTPKPNILDNLNEFTNKVTDIVETTKKTMTDTKKCPYCAETIKAEAVVCRYCSRDLNKKEPQKFDDKLKYIFIVGSLSFIVLLVVGNLINLSQPSYPQYYNTSK